MKMCHSVLACGLLLISCANAASSSSAVGPQYTSNDYLVACVMLRVAQNYFDARDTANQETQRKFKQDLHSLQDMRASDPYVDNAYDVAEGLLFEPKKCRFYSRFGVWHFGRRYMAKAPSRVLFPKEHSEFIDIKHWQAICDVACAQLVLHKLSKTGDRELFEVISYGEDMLPKLELTKRLESVEKVSSDVISGEPDVVEIAVATQTSSWSASLSDLYEALTGWINGELEVDEDEEERLQISEPISVTSSSLSLQVIPAKPAKMQKQVISPGLLTMWLDMKARFVKEQAEDAKTSEEEDTAEEDFVDL